MMRLPVLSHLTPQTLDEALELAAQMTTARFVAGGTDLLPKLKRRQLDTSALISLSHCEELKQIERTDDGGWRIGAGVRLVELVRTPELRSSHPAIWQAASRENVRAGAAAEALSKQLVKAKVGWSTLFKH